MKKKYNDSIPDICNEFSTIYNDILNYYKNTDKTLVIDSAQFRNLRTEKEIKLLKGKIIIIRTSIEECYKRVVNRWKEISKNYNEEELTRYQNRKQTYSSFSDAMNNFTVYNESLIDNIDRIQII